jgi:hypothetical protein
MSQDKDVNDQVRQAIEYGLPAEAVRNVARQRVAKRVSADTQRSRAAAGTPGHGARIA